MITAFQIAAMRKHATTDTSGQNYEEMNKARWIQAAKDLPLVMLGTGLGWGVGKTVADAAAPHLGAAGKMAPYLPGAIAMLSAGGSYMLGQQREAMKGRRDAAAAKAVEEIPSAEKTAALPRFATSHVKPLRERMLAEVLDRGFHSKDMTRELSEALVDRGDQGLRRGLAVGVPVGLAGGAGAYALAQRRDKTK